MPLFHIAGSGWGVAGFCCGGTNIVVREVVPAEILRLVAEYRVTNAIFVPAVLQILLGTPGVETTDFSSLRKIVYGASPISEDVLTRSIARFGCGFVRRTGSPRRPAASWRSRRTTTIRGDRARASCARRADPGATPRCGSSTRRASATSPTARSARSG
jgi:acyl-CoA synthetase (AMP-forming)/AMP-acid ligase II